MITKKKFKIDGMHCTSCSMMIDGDLEEKEGVISASTNYARQEAIIEYDESKISYTKITEIIRNTGYDASLSE